MSSLALFSSLSFSLGGVTPPLSGTASSPTGNGNYPFGGGVELISITHDVAGDLFVTVNDFFIGSGSAIYKMTPGGSVSLFAGSMSARGLVNATGSSARFNYPQPITRLTNGDLVVYDNQNSRVRVITSPGASVTEWAFDTVTVNAVDLYTIAQAPSGELYSSGGRAIYKINNSGTGTQIAGPLDGSTSGHVDGTGTTARFTFINDIALDPTTGDMIVCENSHYIRRVTPAGVVTTIAGNGTSTPSDGAALSAGIPFPKGVAVAPDGTIYFSCFAHHTIRKLSGGVVSTISGQSGSSGWVDAAGTSARYFNPGRMTYNIVDNSLYVIDQQDLVIRKVL